MSNHIPHADRGHTGVSPSSAKALGDIKNLEVGCLAYLGMKRKAPKPPQNEKAADGEKTHEMFELAMRCQIDKLPHPALVGAPYPDERTARVATCIDEVKKSIMEAQPREFIDVHMEGFSKKGGQGEWIDVGRLIITDETNENIEGTADFAAAWWHTNAETGEQYIQLMVKDLKDGTGFVSADYNPQFYCYARGYINYLIAEYGFERHHFGMVSMQVLQPKVENFMEFVTPAEDVFHRTDWLIYQAKQAEIVADSNTALEHYQNYEADRCFFCPAKMECAAFNRGKNASAIVPFVEKIHNPIEGLMTTLTKEQIELLVKYGENFIDLVKAAKSYARASKIEDPDSFPGLKLVRNKKSRCYNPDMDKEEIVEWMKAQGIEEEDIYEKRIKSFGKIEKAKIDPGKSLRGNRKYKMGILEGVLVKPQGELIITDKEDGREEVTQQEIFKEMFN